MEEFKQGDIFYVPFMDSVDAFNCECDPSKERMRLTGPAIFMVEHERDIKNFKDFTDEELLPIARQCKELEDDGYFYDDLVLELSDFDIEENTVPIPLVSKNINIAVHMRYLLTKFCKAYYILRAN